MHALPRSILSILLITFLLGYVISVKKQERNVAQAKADSTYAILSPDLSLRLLRNENSKIETETRYLISAKQINGAVAAKLSSDRHHIAVLSNLIGFPPYMLFLQVFDLKSDKKVEIDNQNIDRDSLAWSPTGDVLLYARQSTSVYQDRLLASYDVVNYNLQTRQLTVFLDDIPYMPTIAWSHSGHQVAIGGRVCYSEQARRNCQLQVFDSGTLGQGVASVASLSLLSLQVRDRLPTAIGSDAQIICKLRWSPDDKFISFIQGCGGTAVIGIQHDLVLWSITEPDAHIATPFSLNVQNETSSGFIPDINLWTEWSDYEWVSTNQVLVSRWQQTLWRNPSSSKTPTTSAVTTQTFLLDTFTKQLQLLGQFTASELARNPVNNWIALRSSANYDVENPSMPAKDKSVQVLSVGGFGLQQMYSATDGCGLDWSSDGKTLFFVQRDLDSFDLTSACVGMDRNFGFQFTQFTETRAVTQSIPSAELNLGSAVRLTHRGAV